MGLEKAIASGKEHRKEYRGAKRVSRSCRNNGEDINTQSVLTVNQIENTIVELKKRKPILICQKI